jgi:hypothetical protein
LGIAFGVSLVAACAAGTVLGVIAVKLDWGFSALVVAVGVPAGLLMRWLRAGRARGSWAAVVAATLAGMALHGWIVSGARPQWSAERELDETQLNFTVQKYLTGQICNERKVFAFGYDEVPQDVKDEAADRMASMTVEEKMSLVDETFGRRINDGQSSRTGLWAYILPSVAVLGAAALAAGTLCLPFRRA